MGQDRTLDNAALLMPDLQFGFMDAISVYAQGGLDYDPLSMLRQLSLANSYAPYIASFPFGSTSNLTFAARETKEGSIQIAPKSYLLAITGYVTALFDNFSLGISDKGSGLGITQRDLSKAGLWTGFSDNLIFDESTDPSGPFLLTSPLIVTEPGLMTVKMTNTSETGGLFMQIALFFAVPINNRSMNTPVMRKVS